ncbi:DUF6624 domain-containing protein [Undibacterium sp. TJN19]|uniref:DUF6624 domain-containing protein n=1 Tax=Undibacterium sp. TJN19 TaxID=3413055 RepID=UPI003BF512BC
MTLCVVFQCALPLFAFSSEKYGNFRDELISMFRDDQAVRNKFNKNDPNTLTDMTTIDVRNSSRLKEIIKAIGWPTEAKVGAEASKGAFFIAQHAARDLPLMELALSNIEESYKYGETSGVYYALIYDRVKMLHGESQKYGTQILRNSASCEAYKLEDADKVDVYRKEIGFKQSLKVYEAEICSRSH